MKALGNLLYALGCVVAGVAACVIMVTYGAATDGVDTEPLGWIFIALVALASVLVIAGKVLAGGRSEP